MTTEQEYYTTSHLGYADFAMKHGFEKIETLFEHYQYDEYKWEKGFIQKDHVDEDGSEWISLGKYRFPKTPHNVALMNVTLNDITTHNGDLVTIILARRINGVLVPMPVWDKE